MKTLAAIKMEKNFIAVLTKRYPRKPYEHYTVQFLIKRLKEEVAELEEAVKLRVYGEAALECGDVSNLVDFIFEQVVRLIEAKKEKDKAAIESLRETTKH